MKRDVIYPQEPQYTGSGGKSTLGAELGFKRLVQDLRDSPGAPIIFHDIEMTEEQARHYCESLLKIQAEGHSNAC